MAYFEPDFLHFFKELAANNHKDWFDANRNRYHKIVKEPFKKYVADVIAAIRDKDPSIQMEPKDAIFRINRDIRFSKNKEPYKIHVSALISRFGKKDKAYPGFYIHLDPENVRFYGGAYQMSPQQTNDLRFAISENMKVFNELINAPKFKKAFGEVHGEKAKRIPKELKSKAEEQPLIFNKSMYYFASEPPEIVLSDDLLKTTMRYYDDNRPLQQFLERKVFS